MDSDSTSEADADLVHAVMFAYACEPGKGSEPGASWDLIQAVRGFARCTVLVAPEHTDQIARHQAAHPDARCEFVEVGEPWWAKYAKWHRVPWFLAYLAWLRPARLEAARRHAEDPFDIAHHVSYSVFWLPSPVSRLGIPSVLGPVGGAARTPVRLWRLLGLSGILDELIDWLAVRAASFLRGTRRSIRDATVRVVQNDDTLERVEARSAGPAIVLNHALFTPAPADRAGSGERSTDLVWISRLESRKGPRLAVRALAEAPAGVRLVMVGEGPEKRRVERLAARLGVTDRLDLRGWVPHDEVLDLLRDAAGFVSTGLREEGGVSLAEALAMGTPVIVLAHGGAKTLAATAADTDRVRMIEPTTMTATAAAIAREMTDLSRRAVPNRGSLIDQSGAAKQMQAVYEQALARPISPE